MDYDTEELYFCRSSEKKTKNKAIEGENIKELELALGRWFCGSRDRGGVRKSRN